MPCILRETRKIFAYWKWFLCVHSLNTLIAAIINVAYVVLDGLIAIVSSCLTGRVWEGFLWAVESAQDFSSVSNRSLTASRTMAGNSDVLWLTENLLAIASDCGLLEVWEHTPLGHALQQLFTLGSHDDMVMSLCHLGKSQKIASGSADSRYMLLSVCVFVCVCVHACLCVCCIVFIINPSIVYKIFTGNQFLQIFKVKFGWVKL